PEDRDRGLVFPLVVELDGGRQRGDLVRGEALRLGEARVVPERRRGEVEVLQGFDVPLLGERLLRGGTQARRIRVRAGFPRGGLGRLADPRGRSARGDGPAALELGEHFRGLLRARVAGRDAGELRASLGDLPLREEVPGALQRYGRDDLR